MWKIAALVLFSAVLAYAAPSKTIIAPQSNGEDWQPPVVYTTMKIGTPGVSFTLVLDQFGEDILIKGPQCSSLSCKGVNNNRTTYEPKSSSTSKDQGDQAKVRYGATVTGEYYTDNVSVNEISDTDVGLAVLNTASTQFYKVNVDGVFGLSFLGSTRGKKALLSPVNSILKGADKKLVSLWFNKATKNSDRYGQLTFGKINTDKCGSTVQYSIVSNDDFNFKVEKIRFSKLVAHRELNANIDPQSRYIGLPTTIYKDFLRVATGSEESTSVYCSNIKDITLDIKIGGVFYSLQTEDFTYQTGSGSNQYCNFLIQDAGEGFDTAYSLGEPFFRRYCITYDVDNREIGFSSSK